MNYNNVESYGQSISLGRNHSSKPKGWRWALRTPLHFKPKASPNWTPQRKDARPASQVEEWVLQRTVTYTLPEASRASQLESTSRRERALTTLSRPAGHEAIMARATLGQN